jgi:UDP-3-O-[3-hydroxymyristoyl] N-acetylglucosamine deacetylase
MFLQRTLKNKAEVSGIGLHTGKSCKISFKPAPPDIGVYFIRTDLPHRPSIKAFASNVRATTNATTLGSDEFSVLTVEHCLSALAAFQIDNLYIELEGPEIPIGDGSAEVFLRAIQEAGFVEQSSPRKYIYIKESLFISDGEKQAYVQPYDGLRITCTIDFPHPAIGKQKIDIDINETSFVREISKARTFGFIQDVESLQKKGLALGVSLDNAIGLDKDRVLNPEGLHYADEFVRHKVLDALGDLVTLGAPLMGHLVLYRAGHDLMNRLVRKILQLPDHIAQVELGESFESAFMAGRLILPYPLN